MLTNDELLGRLQAAIDGAGSLRKWAKAHGIAPDLVSKSMRAPAVFPAVAEALGFKRSTRIWEPIDANRNHIDARVSDKLAG